MKSNQQPEEQTWVRVTCGFFMTIPSAQLSDYYRVHGWFAGFGLVVVLILALALA